MGRGKDKYQRKRKRNPKHTGMPPWFNDPTERLKTGFILAERWGWVCWYCRSKLNYNSFTIDHIIPCAQGGSHELNNLALSCGFCNRAKSDYPLDVFLSWLEFVRYGDSSSLLRDAWPLRQTRKPVRFRFPRLRKKEKTSRESSVLLMVNPATQARPAR